MTTPFDFAPPAHIATLERELARWADAHQLTIGLIGQDDGAALEGGPHAGGDVVGAVGGVQEGLGARGDVPTVQEEAADLDTELRAARFAGEDVVHVRRGQKVGEDADLRRLADAVASFEGDE